MRSSSTSRMAVALACDEPHIACNDFHESNLCPLKHALEADWARISGIGAAIKGHDITLALCHAESAVAASEQSQSNAASSCQT